jgi:hypothetical protein
LAICLLPSGGLLSLLADTPGATISREKIGVSWPSLQLTAIFSSPLEEAETLALGMGVEPG